MIKFLMEFIQRGWSKKTEVPFGPDGIIKITVDFNDRRHGGYVSRIPASPDQTIVQIELLKMLMRALCNFDRDNLIVGKWRGTKFTVEVTKEGKIQVSQA